MTPPVSTALAGGKRRLRASIPTVTFRPRLATSICAAPVSGIAGRPWRYNTLALCRVAELDYAGYFDNFAKVGGGLIHRFLAVRAR